MRFEGTFSTEVSEFGTFDVKDGKSTGVIHVPKKWIDSKVIVLFLNDKEMTDAKDTDNQKES